MTDFNMNTEILKGILRSEEQDSRIRWRDRTIESLGIRNLGWTNFSWQINELPIIGGFRQLILGTSRLNEPISQKKISVLAERIEEKKRTGDDRTNLEQIGGNALLTKTYLGISMGVIDEKQLPFPSQANQGNAVGPNEIWKRATGVMLLGLMYHPDINIAIPDFQHYRASFELLRLVA